jgi:ribulose-phosphate 3-epimerase
MLAYVSLWSADLLALGEAVDLLAGAADGFHIDVFDGHNVPELLFGPDLVAALRARTTTLLDVHLNVSDPDFWAPRFIEAGADMVTVQSGASKDIASTLGSIRAAGAQPSLGLELHELVDRAEELFDDIDRVLVMGTLIGIRGAELDPATPGRVSALVEARTGRFGPGLGPLIVVDGGIRAHTVEVLAEAGADGVVPGSLVFGHPNPLVAIGEIHGLGRGVGVK